jgi:predicted unusual protein kinase regulating ubiquinone biosynthesis (AarF/ABC1/UbiB family)
VTALTDALRNPLHGNVCNGDEAPKLMEVHVAPPGVRCRAMAGDDFDERLRRFVEELRSDTGRAAPGKGLGRLVRTVRGAAGLASRTWFSRGRTELTDSDLASIEGLVTRLGELKGAPMKAGQILGFLEADLPEEMRRMLALLQTQSPATPFPAVEQVLRADLPGDRAEALLAGLERSAISVASIGQVHRARLPGGEAVAVKLRHPGVEDAIRSDFKGAATGAAFARLLVPGAGATAREFVEEAQARFLEECDYRLEADRQRLFGRLFAGHPDVIVPRIHDEWCGKRVLTSAWEPGQGFDAFAAAATQAERDRAGLALFEVYVGTLYRHAVFHADPHPGNYCFREGGRVVVFDYGCVRQFEPSAVAAFVELAESVRHRDDERMRRALVGLGAEPPTNAKAFDHVRGLLESFFAPVLQPGAHRIDGRVAVDARRITRDKLAVARLRLPGKLLFLFRIRFGVYSVLARLGAVCDWGAIERGWADDTRRAGAVEPG